ncbi:glycosyltransferase [Rhodoferax sp. 4810]|uniref:Glycosyltransferase n=1 Tax=Thiospirillum jenense TaxID=1653858 RepID=A0A839H907_9GAMM|nr:glycosyltransferase [Thiospirillum jenense]MBB1073093.1 glycosyltransferase [Rhodoferax jenense]MBB1125040.1 glycosyltransferase [Thiospirillum jenense]
MSIKTRLVFEWRRIRHALAALLHVGNTRTRVVMLEAQLAQQAAILTQLQQQLNQTQQQHAAAFNQLQQQVADEAQRRDELANQLGELVQWLAQNEQRSAQRAELTMTLMQKIAELVEWLAHQEARLQLQAVRLNDFQQDQQREFAAVRNELAELKTAVPRLAGTVLTTMRQPLDMSIQRQLDELRADLRQRQLTVAVASNIPVAPLPPLRCFDAPVPWLPAHPGRDYLVTQPYTLLYVGALQPDHAQSRLLECLYQLRRVDDGNVALILASPLGAADDANYLAALTEYAAQLGLSDQVELRPQANSAQLSATYHAADLYLSLAEPSVLTNSATVAAVQRALWHELLVLVYGVTPIMPMAQLLPNEARLTALAADQVVAEIKQVWCDRNRRQRQWAEQRRRSGYAPALVTAPLTVRIEGPCDSSYSLALVNTGVARALHHAGDQVALYQTDGYGDTRPQRSFLATNPDLAPLTRSRLRQVMVTLRNVYPPRTNALRGLVRIIGPYGWEESGFPHQWIRAFNRRLSGVLCLSDYVRDVLIANGLKIPAITTGLVADALLDHSPRAPAGVTLPGGYRLLHVSSGFPRKGVDVLLQVHSRLPPEMALIIKTFANPHNVVEAELTRWGYRRQGRDAVASRWVNGPRRVLVIEVELAPAEMVWLYQQVNQLVAPSRGEGFGLPMAEAMLFDVPVVTTDAGGQRDFCTPETAWLVRSRLVAAQTHFALPGSQWAAPDAASLRAAILAVRAASAAERRSRTTAARALVLARYSQAAVAWRIHAAVVALN